MAQSTTSVQKMQADRAARAASEPMSFALVTIRGRRADGTPFCQQAISVQSKSSGYTVPVPGCPGRCNCKDSQGRLKGTAATCKHTIAAHTWYQQQQPAAPVLDWMTRLDQQQQARRQQEAPAPDAAAERRARCAARIDSDFPV